MEFDLSNVIFFAFRYALGKLAFAPSEFCEWAEANLDLISMQQKKQMLMEIGVAVHNGNAGRIENVDTWLDFAERLRISLRDGESDGGVEDSAH
jgi:hypothetical protein